MEDFMANEEFHAISPDKIHEMMDRDHVEGFGQSMGQSMLEDADMRELCQKDTSLGAYFKGRSSYPFPSLNGEITLLDRVDEEPEREFANVSRRSIARKCEDDSLFTSIHEPLPRASPKMIQDSIFGSMREEEPRTSPGLAQDSMFAPAEKEFTAAEPMRQTKSIPIKLGQDSLFVPFEPKTPAGSKVLTPRNSAAYEINSRDDNEEANDSTSSIRSLQEFFSDPDNNPLSSSDIMDYVLEYCRARNTKGTGKGVVKEIAQRHKGENLSMLSRRLSQELGDRKMNYNDFDSSLRKKMNSSRCSTPDVMSIKSSSSSSGYVTSRKSLPARSSPKQQNIIPTSSTAASCSTSPPKKARAQAVATSEIENRSPSTVAANPQQVQIQLNLPQNSNQPMQNYQGPLIINIVCPFGYSQGSAVQRIDPQANSSQVINVRSDYHQESRASSSSATSSSSSAAPHIAVQFSGCIQWKQ